MYEEFLDGRLIVKVGDLTEEDVDAIVNAANSALLGGGGVDGAIHRAGGPAIVEECRRIRATTPTGEAVITTGGNLKAQYVIHTVGPIYGQHGGREAELLAASYRNSLELAIMNSLSSIAFPSISTGAYGYPKNEAAKVSSDAIIGFLDAYTVMEQVRLIFFSKADAALFLRVWD